MLMGYREYARHRGVTLGAVQKAIRDNRIAATVDKKIDSVLADQAWKDNTDASRIAVNVIDRPAMPAQQEIFSPLAPAGAEGEKPPAAADEVTGADRTANEYREHRAQRERWSALKQQREYEQLIGQLINVEDAKRIAYTMFRALRDSVLNIPARVKDQLAAESDPLACELLLEHALSGVLSSIDIGKLLVDEEE